MSAGDPAGQLAIAHGQRVLGPVSWVRTARPQVLPDQADQANAGVVAELDDVGQSLPAVGWASFSPREHVP